MNNLNFNYWLQGLFELTERDTNRTLESELVPSLSEAQVNCIREHLELVKKSEPLYGFAAWLEGYMDARVGQVGGEIGAQGYMAISERSKQSFVHVPYSMTHTASSISAMISAGGAGGSRLGGAGTLLTC